jgi:hypothetical protein
MTLRKNMKIFDQESRFQAELWTKDFQIQSCSSNDVDLRCRAYRWDWRHAQGNVKYTQKFLSDNRKERQNFRDLGIAERIILIWIIGNVRRCRVSSSGIWCRVVRWVLTDVSEEHIASIFRVEEISSAKTSHLVASWLLMNLFLRPWRWRLCVPPKRRFKLDRLHGVISQKMILFITTAVKTSNPTGLD